MTEQLQQPVPRERGPGRRTRIGSTLVPDLGASLVVFLVALPLCVGVAVASGVPAELGIVTGVVGGVVVGLLPGSTMQVSGPAAGLTVLVADTVATHGAASLGLIVLGAGLLQVLLGALRLGRWFRAISPAVVQGMLAGIGLVLILGQLYPLVGRGAPGTTAEKFFGLPALVPDLLGPAAALGALTVVVAVLWKRRAPAGLAKVPGVLVAVVVASAVAVLVDVPRIRVGALADELTFVGEAPVTPALIGVVLTFALVASAESLFSAAAVDRMHDGPRTHYDRELVAQGVGNALCGLVGALPMTAVIVRSAANVDAGARTRASRVLHGVWLLVFVALLPQTLAFIPLAVLAGLLVHAGWKLLEPRRVLALARTDRAEAAVLVLTAALIVTTDLLTGTLAGLLAAVVKTAWDVSRLSVTVDGDRVEVRGNATFLRLPQLLDRLEAVPGDRRLRLDMAGVRHQDQACRQAVEQWAARRGDVELIGPGAG
ncbi:MULTISPECIES: SulP family inorganic anion transporter [Actinosynnema]|uniref:SulP family inorganic anion transporter n=1 Tax=Actinosynnema TaxID=40566 RepID=UPI0020A46DBA|nr:SulP family inorganic anion transporter [Actinosynnema pretiosum]MCP2093049.1 Sulfate permease, MFS superfamily [Actinosynnema pretiosum]